MNFGQAIEALKEGKKVTRKGWNGKKMFLWLKPATQLKSDFLRDPILKQTVDDNGGTMEALGTICMKTADNRILTGWLASQTDMLSEDWEIVLECENSNKQTRFRFDSMEHNEMVEEIDSILSSIQKWAEGDKENRSFILICSDLKKDEKYKNSQCMFSMQGKNELIEFSLFQIFNEKDASIFKEMVNKALTLSIMSKLTSK